MSPERRPRLVVLSHLRWTWVWQRPQHLISRFTDTHDVLFVEEPVPADVRVPRPVSQRVDGLTRWWMEVPRSWRPGYSPEARRAYATALRRPAGRRPNGQRIHVWMYTPMALEIARHLDPDQLVFDVMDDLSAFKGADPYLKLSHRQALREADLVFTGGRSLHTGVVELRAEDVHLFPSGVDPEHYRSGVRRRGAGERPVAGYVGVIDERVDLDLVARLARELRDWDIHMVGPVAKIDPDVLPQADNIVYLGQQAYAELPDRMADMDVALMPFALNEATRSISPTKTLEYLAAGLPVVSTSVPDVVASYADVVRISEPAGFAAAVLAPVPGDVMRHRRRVRALLDIHRWDAIAARMSKLMDEHRATSSMGIDVADAAAEVSA